MPTAVVCAAFDTRGDAAVLELQARLTSLGVRVPREPAHRPHITLAAVDADPAQVAAIADRVAARHPPCTVTLDTVGTFARGTIVWLGPSRDDGLARLQKQVHAALGAWPPAFGAQTDPGRWVAHCTLARRAPSDAARRLRAGFSPIEVRVVALATLLVGGRGDHALAPLRG